MSISKMVADEEQSAWLEEQAELRQAGIGGTISPPTGKYGMEKRQIVGRDGSVVGFWYVPLPKPPLASRLRSALSEWRRRITSLSGVVIKEVKSW